MEKLLILFFVFCCCSCTESTVKPEGNDTSSSDTITPAQIDSTLHTAAQKDTGLFGIQLTDSIILSLQQWDSTINLQAHLGKPLKERTRQLDQNSDTFAGSFMKDLEYDGLKLQLFSPPQNGKTFWVQEIILTSNKYKTTKSIGLGDGWEKVKQSYPSLQKFPGENKNMYFVADNGYEKSMEMEFENNRLKKLRLYYMMN